MDATQVVALLRDNRLFEETDEGVLLRAAVRALGAVKDRLRNDVADTDVRIAVTAAALARYQLFADSLESAERFSSFRAGDLTIQRDLKAEYAAERALRDEALAQAAPILKDGGFFVGAS